MIAGSASPTVEQETPPVRAGGVILLGEMAGGGRRSTGVNPPFPHVG